MASLKKERIKDQMLKTAARLWGAQDGEIENNFDPLILLLIEACAAELEKINHDITASNTRLLDYLANLILPESHLGATPASAVVQALAVESRININSSTNFHLTRQIQNASANRVENVELNFTPIGDFVLLNSQLKYLMLGNKLFHIKENNDKELIFSNKGSNLSNNIWLALSCDEALVSLQGLSIFFDLRGHSAAHKFYNSLAYANCWVNEIPVQVKQGYYQSESFELGLKDILLSGDDRSNKINRKIGFTYENRFVSLTGNEKIVKAIFPEELKQNLTDELVKQLESEKLVFIKIQLSQYFLQDVLDPLTCSINAFPVVNRKLQTFNHRTNDWLNIVPLNVEGLFFDLLRISNEKGSNYKIRPSAATQDIAAGEAILRKSGVGKTDSTEVRDMINSIAESIRDQSAFFGHLTNQFILDRLTEISKILAGLEDQMAVATDLKPDYNYLMLRPKEKGEMISIDYWITNGSDANQVNAGTSLTPANSLINSKKTHTLTVVSGGKNGASNSEKKTILRQQLNSGGKVISVEDIKLTCIQLFEGKLIKVDVQKGVQVSDKKDGGFNRTIDVIITCSKPMSETMTIETDNLCRELEFILQNNASPVYPFRVIIQ